MMIFPIKEEAVMNDFPRITRNPTVMGGKPCIRGLRVTVGMVVGQIGAGRTVDELLADYPYLEREDIPRHCDMQPGAPRNAKSSCPKADEVPGGHEPVAKLGEFSM
jgi:uncharacterized protein (DUF433 family)